MIIDDHTLVREGLKKILAEAQDITCQGEAGDAREALNIIKEKKIDVVLLDISMPGMNGLELLKRIRQSKPSLHILMLSMYPEEHYAIRAVKAGASGYLTKEMAAEELISAIQLVSKGRKYITESLAEKMAFELGNGASEKHHTRLSDREYQVLCEIASGKTVSQIAKKTFLSVKTVSTYRCRLLEKLQLDNNAQLTNYAFKENLIA